MKPQRQSSPMYNRQLMEQQLAKRCGSGGGNSKEIRDKVLAESEERVVLDRLGLQVPARKEHLLYG